MTSRIILQMVFGMLTLNLPTSDMHYLVDTIYEKPVENKIKILGIILNGKRYLNARLSVVKKDLRKKGQRCCKYYPDNGIALPFQL